MKGIILKHFQLKPPPLAPAVSSLVGYGELHRTTQLPVMDVFTMAICPELLEDSSVTQPFMTNIDLEDPP